MITSDDAREILDALGVHVETCANEAAACAMLSASINYPVRGCAVWKSTVGTNVASDTLSNLASAGVTGGALIVVGEDYGDGSSIIQERSHAFAMKSQVWLLDPRPSLPAMVRAVEKGFGKQLTRGGLRTAPKTVSGRGPQIDDTPVDRLQDFAHAIPRRAMVDAESEEMFRSDLRRRLDRPLFRAIAAGSTPLSRSAATAQIGSPSPPSPLPWRAMGGIFPGLTYRNHSRMRKPSRCRKSV